MGVGSVDECFLIDRLAAFGVLCVVGVCVRVCVYGVFIKSY